MIKFAVTRFEEIPVNDLQKTRELDLVDMDMKHEKSCGWWAVKKTTCIGPRKHTQLIMHSNCSSDLIVMRMLL